VTRTPKKHAVGHTSWYVKTKIVRVAGSQGTALAHTILMYGAFKEVQVVRS